MTRSGPHSPSITPSSTLPFPVSLPCLADSNHNRLLYVSRNEREPLEIARSGTLPRSSLPDDGTLPNKQHDSSDDYLSHQTSRSSGSSHPPEYLFKFHFHPLQGIPTPALPNNAMKLCGGSKTVQRKLVLL